MQFSVMCMRSTDSETSRGRFTLVATAVTLILIGAVWALAVVLRDTAATILAPGRSSVDELITAVSATVSLALLAWVGLGLLVSVTATLPGRIGRRATGLAAHLAPATVRHWAGLLLGVALAGTIAPAGAAAAPAALTQAVAPAPGWAGEESSPAPSPEWTATPDWTPLPVREQPPVSLTVQREVAADESHQVVVRRGDTLWDLAAAFLSPDATDAQIAAEWQRWHAANREVIGPDPDLILPGQVLVRPVDSLASGLVGGSR